MRLWRWCRPSRPRRIENHYKPRVKYCEERFCAGSILSSLMVPMPVLGPSILASEDNFHVDASSYVEISATASAALRPENTPFNGFKDQLATTLDSRDTITMPEPLEAETMHHDTGWQARRDEPWQGQRLPGLNLNFDFLSSPDEFSPSRERMPLFGSLFAGPAFGGAGGGGGEGGGGESVPDGGSVQTPAPDLGSDQSSPGQAGLEAMAAGTGTTSQAESGVRGTRGGGSTSGGADCGGGFSTMSNLPVVNIWPTDREAAEAGLDPGEFTLMRDGDMSGELIVSVDVGGGSAELGVDFTVSASGGGGGGAQRIVPVTFAAGDATAKITVDPIDDDLAEGSETVVGTIQPSAAYEIGMPAIAVVTIADDEAPSSVPVVSISATDPDAAEACLDPGEFTVVRSGPTTADLAVSFEVSGTATAWEDYADFGTGVIIPAGFSSATIPVSVFDDMLAEGDENVIVGLLEDPAYTLGVPHTAMVWIADDAADSFPVVSIEATDPNASEIGVDPGEFTVTRTGPLTTALQVEFALMGTAIAGTDYHAVPSQSVIIPVGLASAPIEILPLLDDLEEGDETIDAILLPASGYAVGQPAQATVFLLDDDADAGPQVKVVHPIDADFATGKVGRIMFSTHHDTQYHTTVITTAENKVAQTGMGKVTISAYLDELAAGVKVYFEVIDPDDSSSYREDRDPTTLWSFAARNHNIEGPVADANANDNRDGRVVNGVGFSMVGGTLEKYDRFQRLLSSRWVITELRTINAQQVAVAEVVLTTTDRAPGDNYVVRATTVDPQGRPFNDNSGVTADRNADASIPDGRIGPSALLTGWSRVYYEQDLMYRVGSPMSPANKGQTSVVVDDPQVFSKDDRVRIFDSTNQTGDLLTVQEINLSTRVLTLSGPLTNGYGGPWAYVGKETGRPATDFFLPDTSKLSETFDDAYYEIKHLANGSTGIPRIDGNTPAQRNDIRDTWFNNRGNSGNNYFYVVGASTASDPGLVGQTRPPDNQNWTFLFVGTMETLAPMLGWPLPPAMRDTVNHELVHHFDNVDVESEAFSHDDDPAHSNFNEAAHDNPNLLCLMNLRANNIDDRYELGIEHLYKLRDVLRNI